MAEKKFTPQLASIFASLVEDASGLYYGPKDRELFGAKLASQALEVGYESLLDYYYRLRYEDRDGVELRALIEALLVHETYFFRELQPLQALVEVHLAEVVRVQGRARVWSAACATGEEPLTLAMLLDEQGLLDQVEIIATDISDDAISRACADSHSIRALRTGHPEALALRYLTVTDSAVTTAQRIRDAVQYRTLNVFDHQSVEKLGLFDAILFRNALIYFSDVSVTKVIDQLGQSLARGGMISVGVSESLIRYGTSLVCEERGGAFFYRRAT